LGDAEKKDRMSYTVTSTVFPEVLILEPVVQQGGDWVMSFDLRAFHQATKTDFRFVQDNHSRSSRGVLRGLHYQIQHAQGKLVQVITGAVFDVAVDLRKSSANFGKWSGLELSAENRRQLWIPPGFAHGFLVLSDSAEFLYKTTDYYSPEYERCLAWNDPTIGIDWPLHGEPVVSAKDATGKRLADAECFE
jgi:dTDP-4-dehydrorhamnose 3,5-epimerase